MISAENNIADIMRYCNNDFNGNYPPEFSALADRILEYRNSTKTSNIVKENVIGVYSWQAAAVDGLPADWTQIFKNELSAYRRLKLI